MERLINKVCMCSNHKFKSQMKRLLKNYNPPIDIVYDLINEHYPKVD